MTSVYTLNLLDRGVMAILLQPIKLDLQLTDTQLGLVTGIAFGLFYATLGVPIARWSDRADRSTIASLAIGLWGLTVMATFLVANYAQLVMARIAAAVGESGCKPPTYSMIGDYFVDPRERTRAMAVYMTGNPLAVLLAFGLGGWLNELYGWRMTFFLIGIPGLVAAVIVKLTVKDPRTQTIDAAVRPPAAPIRTVFATLWRQRSFRHVTIALILLYVMSQGLSPWQAAFMMRSHGMATAELGAWLGLIFSGAGLVGILSGGYIASRWFGGDERAQMNLSAWAVALSSIPFVAFLLLPQKEMALLALIPKVLLFNVFLGPTYALMQRLVPDNMRATMMALVMLLANLLGMGIGPLIVGALSDLLMPAMKKDSLRYAMLLVSFIAFWAAYHFWRAGVSVKTDLAKS